MKKTFVSIVCALAPFSVSFASEKSASSPKAAQPETSQEFVVEPNQSKDMTLADGHVIRFKSGRYKVETQDKLNPKITILSGKIFGYFKKSVNPSRLKVITKTSVMGVRGTKFYVEEAADKSYFCVCEGVLTVESQNQSYNVAAGEDLWVDSSLKKTKVTKASQNMFDMVANEFAAMGLPVK